MADDRDDHGPKGPTVVPFKPKRKTASSAKYLAVLRELDSNPLTKGLVAFDTFSRTPMLMRPVPLPDVGLDKAFKPRPLADADFVALVMFLETRNFGKLTPGVVRAVLDVMLQQAPMSPPADLIRSLVWDGKKRLSWFFLDCGGVLVVGDSDVERDLFRGYVERVTRCFFISVVARVLRPGCKVDTVLVLEGIEGILKSTLLRIMALRDEWFSDTLTHDLTLKDARQHLPGNLIIEMAELSALKRSEVETVKAFISTQVDKYRPSYGALEIAWPRQNVFVGTTNDEDYLVGDTGNRRFWPLRIGNIDLDSARAVIEQIYAEARVAFESGEQWWLDDETEAVARIEQDERHTEDPWFADIADLVREQPPELDGARWLAMDKVFKAVGVEKPKQDMLVMKRIGRLMRKLGGKRKLRRMGKQVAKEWRFDV